MTEPTSGNGERNAVANQGSSRNAGRRTFYRRGGGSNRNGGTSQTSSFKGDMKAMNGHVFQTHSERNKPGQFKDTLNALKLLASTEYKKDLLHLEPLFKRLESPKVPLPTKPEPEEVVEGGVIVMKVNEVKTDIYKEKVKAYSALEDRLNATTTALFNIVWSQCSKLLKGKLKLSHEFERVENEADVAELLKEIRSISYKIDPNQCIYDAIDELQRQFFLYRQMDGNNEAHLAKFKDFIDVMEHFGIAMFEDECCVKKEKEDDARIGVIKVSDEEYKSRVREKRLATCFLRRANMQIYSPLMRELRDSYLHKIDIYPNTLEDAYNLLQNHSTAKKRRPTNERNGNVERNGSSNNREQGQNEVVTGVQHAQRRGESNMIVTGTDGRTMPRVLCYRCGNRGHYSDHCPEAENSEETTPTIDPKVQNHMHGAVIDENFDEEDGSEGDDVVIGFTHHTMESGRTQVDKDSILLDTGSNCSVFNNAEFLTNIRKSERTLRAFTNGGSQDSTHIGHLNHFFDVWFNPNSMMNILSFSEVGKKYRITFDSDTGKDIVVLGVNGRNWRFKEVSSGLYLLENPKNIKHSVDNYSLFNLDRHNDVIFTKRQLKQAALAKQLYSHCNCPGYNLFIRLIQNNYFRNSPITIEDVKRSLEIYGRDKFELQGKGTRKRPIPIQEMDIIPLPSNVLNHNRDIQLSVDYLYINGIAMLHSISGRSYQFRTLQPLFKSKANKTYILDGICSIIKIYRARGINIKQINGDNEFHCMKHDFLPSVFNIVASEEHVGDIEKSVRTIKDGTRVHISRLPFRKYPRAMVAGAAMNFFSTQQNCKT